MPGSLKKMLVISLLIFEGLRKRGASSKLEKLRILDSFIPSGFFSAQDRTSGRDIKAKKKAAYFDKVFITRTRYQHIK
ncbi:hypothetical protein PITCH_A640076 [uncultured Desulfobacterium sp.]|uniref:Uncharacterized protein n=1 Tax=uncultured Desulfobacterium sp. TaxID=201089 RepID=A0A445N1F2_9BACT|nr:hypothetical protein PITCH_A640076 [uncultured Desulfobacterium sp.]